MSVLDDLGPNEGLSEYRACQHYTDDGAVHWVVEATRVEIICVAADEETALRFSAALNEEAQNTDV